VKQVIRKGLKDIIVAEVADPVATPHHVLVRPIYSLISAGTETADIHSESIVKEVAEDPSHLRRVWEVAKQMGPLRTIAEVRAKFSEYGVLGYSGAGIVIDKHETVTDLEVGSRVAYGGEGVGHGETISTGRKLIAGIPASVSFAEACFTTLGSIAMNATRLANIGVGDVVVVIGLGLVGQLVSQLVRVQGGVVLAVDLMADRAELAKRMGADHGLIGSESTPQEILALTEGRGADCVIVAAASDSPVPVHQALQISRDRGRVVVVGAVPLDLPRDQMYMKELQVLMARAYGPGSYDPEYEKRAKDYPLPYVRWTENRNMEEFLRLVAAGRVQVGPLVSHEFALEDAPRAYETVMSSETKSLGVLLRYPAAAAPEKAATMSVLVRKVVTGSAFPTGRETLRVALAGAGNLAKWAHLPNLKKIPGAALHAVYSSSGARGKSYALRFGAAYSCTDYDAILRDKDIDIVLIASRHQYHCEQALQALEAGKHVFLEKPFAITEEECRQLFRVARGTDRQLTVGFNRRFSPYYLSVKRLLVQRSSPVVINCRINSPALSGSSWAADPEIGGALVGEGCHFVDLLYWLLDSPPVQVFAQSLPRGKQDPIGENNIAATLRFADGSIGNLTYCTVGSNTSGGERVEIFGPGFGASTEDMKRFTVNRRAVRRRSRWFAEKGYLAQLQAFIRGIQTGNQPNVTARDGAQATIGCLLMLQSARTGQPLMFDLPAILGEAE